MRARNHTIVKNNIFNGTKINAENSLSKLIQQHNPVEAVNLKVLRGKEETTISAILDEMK